MHKTTRSPLTHLEDDGGISPCHHSIFTMPLHRPGQHAALNLRATALELRHVVTVSHANNVLLDDRAFVELRGGVVSRSSNELHAPFFRLEVGPGAGEGWQKGV